MTITNQIFLISNFCSALDTDFIVIVMYGIKLYSLHMLDILYKLGQIFLLHIN